MLNTVSQAITTSQTVTASQAVTTTVPMVTGSHPVPDGSMKREWARALVLPGFGPDGSPDTHFYVQHDGESLWVAVDCAEPDKAGPHARPRSSEAELAIDDAVSVALGLPGGAEREIAMGGYEGATAGKVAPLAHLYEFTVNAAGSLARKYDEAALPTPHFEARVRRSERGWQAELRIPFESLGLKNAPGREIYANFVRYRHSGTIAWRGMNKWGGYRPFPVALLRLAASPAEAVAHNPEDDTPATSKAMERIEGNAGQAQLQPLEYYPLSDTVLASIRLERGETATLSAGGATKQSEPGIVGAAHILLPLPQRPQAGKVVEATLEVRDAQGQLRSTEKRSFEATPVPTWAGTDAGQEYLKDKVPWPWKAPEVQGKVVALTHGVITFGDAALPDSIVGADGELLARPSRIELWSGKKELAVRWDKPVVGKNGVRPVILGRGHFGDDRIEVRTEVDYDGFMMTQVRLDGRPDAVDRIQFVYPLREKFARYSTRGKVQGVLPIDNAGYKGEGGERFWLGAETGGLAISTDLPFFRAANKLDEIRVQQAHDYRELILTPADRAAQLAPGTVLQFYMQPTPVRPPSKTTRDDYDLWFEQWSDYQGYPDLKKMPQVREHVEKAHAAGKQQLLYYNQLMAENAPDFAEHREEIVALPERNWYQRSYDPGKGVSCYVSCNRGPYGDLLLDGIRRLADEGGIDGIYMDGTSVVWDCDTPSHLACDIHRQPVWGQPGPTPIIGARDFLKRLRGIFDAKKKPFTLVAHTGGDLDINTLGLVDFFVEGEQLSRNLPQYRIPQAQFAIGYSGTPWGYRTLFHDFWLNGRGQNWSLAYTLIFNTDDYGGASRTVLKPFTGGNATFHPYWEDGQALLSKSKTGKTAVSYHRSNENVMAVVSNFGFLNDEVELNIALLGNTKADEWIDILTGQTYRASGGKLRVTLPPYHGVALRPREQVAEMPTFVRYSDPRVGSSGYIYLPDGQADAAAAVPTETPRVPEITGMDPASWKVNLDGGGVRRTDVAATTDSPAQLVLGSKAGGSEAKAWLAGSAIGGDAEMHLRIESENRPVMRLEFGNVDIICSNGRWNINGAFDGWNDRQVQQAAWPEKQEVELVVSVVNDELTIRLDNQLIADRMKLDSRFSPPRPLKIVTWSDSSLTFTLQSLTARPAHKTVPEIVHPVMP